MFQKALLSGREGMSYSTTLSLEETGILRKSCIHLHIYVKYNKLQVNLSYILAVTPLKMQTLSPGGMHLQSQLLGKLRQEDHLSQGVEDN